MERQIIEHPGTPLFVRPLYDDGTWVPTLIEYGVLTDEQLWRERFKSGPAAPCQRSRRSIRSVVRFGQSACALPELAL